MRASGRWSDCLERAQQTGWKKSRTNRNGSSACRKHAWRSCSYWAIQSNSFFCWRGGDSFIGGCFRKIVVKRERRKVCTSECLVGTRVAKRLYCFSISRENERCLFYRLMPVPSQKPPSVSTIRELLFFTKAWSIGAVVSGKLQTSAPFSNKSDARREITIGARFVENLFCFSLKIYEFFVISHFLVLLLTLIVRYLVL